MCDTYFHFCRTVHTCLPSLSSHLACLSHSDSATCIRYLIDCKVFRGWSGCMQKSDIIHLQRPFGMTYKELADYLIPGTHRVLCWVLSSCRLDLWSCVMVRENFLSQDFANLAMKKPMVSNSSSGSNLCTMFASSTVRNCCSPVPPMWGSWGHRLMQGWTSNTYLTFASFSPTAEKSSRCLHGSFLETVRIHTNLDVCLDWSWD